jgi:hydroxyacylglutathione hydrolase
MSQKTDFESKKANPHFVNVIDIVAEELEKKKADVVLIDVRQPEEFNDELGHIPGAQLIVLNTLPQNLDALPKDQTVVFVCRGGSRSAQAAAYALQNGFSDVYNLKGGMIRWNELGLIKEN